MNRRMVLGLLVLAPVVAAASVPAPFDYARGELEHGVVLDDLTAGTYYYHAPPFMNGNGPTIREVLVDHAREQEAVQCSCKQEAKEDQ